MQTRPDRMLEDLIQSQWEHLQALWGICLGLLLLCLVLWRMLLRWQARADRLEQQNRMLTAELCRRDRPRFGGPSSLEESLKRRDQCRF
jgi:hypothetical protein